MTESRPSRRRRWSRSTIRVTAWVTGAATFFAGVGALGAAPKPANGATSEPGALRRPPRQTIIVRRVIRRVVIVEPTAPEAPVYVVDGGSSSSSSSSGSSNGGSAPAPAPAPAPTTTTGS